MKKMNNRGIKNQLKIKKKYILRRNTLMQLNIYTSTLHVRNIVYYFSLMLKCSFIKKQKIKKRAKRLLLLTRLKITYTLCWRESLET